MTTRKIAFVGDLHLEGRMAQYIPNYDDYVIGEVDRIATRVAKKGYDTICLLGDICDHYSMSVDNIGRLVHLFNKHSNLKWVLIRGNHDVDSKHESEEQSDSLKLLHQMYLCGYPSNVVVARNKPMTLFKDDAPIRLVPWPSTSTKADALNVVHLDCKGSKMDNGHPSESEWETDHTVVSGHLHTRQQVRNTYYPGTPHQTYFGEGHEKFILLVKWTGKHKTSTFEYVPWFPKYTLRTAVINSTQEYEKLCKRFRTEDGQTLYRVVVNSKDVVLPLGAFDAYPCVVKTNKFKTQSELKAVMLDELSMDSESMEEADVNHALNEWLRTTGVDVETTDRALNYLNRLIAS